MIGEILGIVDYTDGDLVKIYAAKSRNEDGTYVTSKDYVGNEKYAIWVTYVEDTFAIMFKHFRPGGNSDVDAKIWTAYDENAKKIPLTLNHDDIFDCIPGASKDIFEKVKESQRMKWGEHDHSGSLSLMHDVLEDNTPGIPAGQLNIIMGRSMSRSYGKTSMIKKFVEMHENIHKNFQLHDFSYRKTQ